MEKREGKGRWRGRWRGRGGVGEGQGQGAGEIVMTIDHRETVCTLNASPRGLTPYIPKDRQPKPENNQTISGLSTRATRRGSPR